MNVFIVIEEHRAEGGTILAVYDTNPTTEEIEALASVYDPDEQAKWCHRFVEEWTITERGKS